ncbi:hypothetical protein IV203_012779 [Nitzschia inconspicua]|uniref:Uncharacterized protein n=1 Tax=Nitzschia inconspicua TaxID=303405 RepID=A0A9K3K8Z8_9STRA|nr:hypothetical protein IV203_012771 [Nitzschia inconspicua]KAG7350054.1 hypothetical protein IV203_012651 [Nitzschia inconspicua]KAG7373684.1 hypothetical protein IV203_012779 [Nitzschia inconspicua]
MSSSSASSRESTPPPHNLLPAPTIDDGSGPVSAERFLAIHSNKLSVLFAICIGLEETIEDKTVPLMDLNEVSFKLIKKKKDIKPSLEILREEVKRRSESNKQDGNKPKPNGWSAKKCTDWGKSHHWRGRCRLSLQEGKRNQKGRRPCHTEVILRYGGTSFKEIIAETSKESTLAADRRHAEDKKAAKNRILLQDSLE